ncbi:MAG: Uma2 family endonuclease [Thermomicrobiales bacterium]
MVTRALPPELTDDEWRELGLDPNDPFRYGWRYVAHEQADGKTTYEQVPLTLEDVLHPQEEDHVVQGEEHIDWCFYLYAALRHLLSHDPTAVVFQDLLFLWDIPGLKGHAPDIAVVFGVRRGRRSSFDVSAEGARPAMIIELASPSTGNLDRQTKLEEYHIIGVPFYFIIDQRIIRRQATLRLLGYRNTPVGYEPLMPNERGWLWMEPVRAWLGIVEGPDLLHRRGRANSSFRSGDGRWADSNSPGNAEVIARIAAERRDRSDSPRNGRSTHT